MMAVEVRPFGEDNVAAAGRLLAARHAAHVAQEPLLDPRFADPDAATDEVAAAWSAQGASGAVALDDGEVVGYLVGAPKVSETWGPNVWVESSGLAVRDPESARDLYGVASARWVDEGRTAHYVLLPAHDRGLCRAFFRCAFGLQHVHGIREPLPGFTDPTVRRATPGDAVALTDVFLELPAHQGRAPVFSQGPVDTREEAQADAAGTIDDAEMATFVVERDGAVVGAAVGCALTKSSAHAGPARADRSGFLGFAAVLPAARGTGAGRAVGDAVLGWAADEGYRSVVTDWRSTNLLSSRAWPALGFRSTFLRLHRLVGY